MPKARASTLCLGLILALSCAGASAGTVDTQWIEQRLLDPKVQTIDDLLDKLPSSYTQYFTLAHHSDSLQKASAAHPRAILYGQDAKLLMAFNGHASHQGYEKLELIEFQDNTSRFRFYSLERGASGALQLTEQRKDCAGCHGAEDDLRPNWAAYNIWPGFFGARADATDRVYGEPGEPELIQTFFDGAPYKHPRYSKIFGLYESFGIQSPRGRRLQESPNHTRNSNFTNRLAQLNFARIARILRDSPEYPRYKFAIVGSLLCTYQLPDFAPVQYGLEPFRGIHPFQEGTYQTAFYEIMNRLGLKISELSMLPPGSPQTATGIGPFGTPGSVIHELAAQVALGDPEIASYLPVRSLKEVGFDRYFAEPLARDCEELAQASYQAFVRQR